MTKFDLLGFLNRRTQVDAVELAAAFDEPYPTAAMALLRALRQGLVERFVDPKAGTYWYRLSVRGKARLGYLQGSTS